MSSSEWQKTTLGSIVNILSGGTPSTRVLEYWSNEIKWVTAKDVSESSGYKVYDTDRKISKLGLENSPANIIPKQATVLIARGATMGRCCMLGEDMAINQTCFALTAKEGKIHPYFLFYAIKNLNDYFQKIAHGAIFNTVIGSGLRETEISLPPLPTQRHIADILSALDEKIELNRQTNVTLEAIAQSIFREWFVEFNYPNATGEMVESELGMIPRGWRVGKLGELYKTTSGGTPSRARSDFYENGVYQWVKSKELNGSFIVDTEEKINDDALKNSSAKLLPKHSVLIAMYGATVGQIGIISNEATTNQAICAFIPNQDYQFSFVYQFLKNSKDDIISRAVGSAQQNISQELLKNLILIIPDVITMKEYHAIVEPLF